MPPDLIVDGPAAATQARLHRRRPGVAGIINRITPLRSRWFAERFETTQPEACHLRRGIVAEVELRERCAVLSRPTQRRLRRGPLPPSAASPACGGKGRSMSSVGKCVGNIRSPGGAGGAAGRLKGALLSVAMACITWRRRAVPALRGTGRLWRGLYSTAFLPRWCPCFQPSPQSGAACRGCWRRCR
jgi:hypothetical protein